MKPAISVDRLHQRLLKIERRRGQEQLTPEKIGQAVWRAQEVGELPESPEARKVVCNLLDTLTAIEKVQEGITEDEANSLSGDIPG